MTSLSGSCIYKAMWRRHDGRQMRPVFKRQSSAMSSSSRLERARCLRLSELTLQKLYFNCDSKKSDLAKTFLMQVHFLLSSAST